MVFEENNKLWIGSSQRQVLNILKKENPLLLSDLKSILDYHESWIIRVLNSLIKKNIIFISDDKIYLKNSTIYKLITFKHLVSFYNDMYSNGFFQNKENHIEIITDFDYFNLYPDLFLHINLELNDLKKRVINWSENKYYLLLSENKLHLNYFDTNTNVCFFNPEVRSKNTLENLKTKSEVIFIIQKNIISLEENLKGLLNYEK